MRPPLDIKMFIRSAHDDQKYLGEPGVKRRHLLNSPAGGAFGWVRSGGHVAHQGWDIYAPVNTPILAIASGSIVSAGHHTGYGRSIILRFDFPGYPNGLFALYGHLCQTSVGVGAHVHESDVLGYTGTDGNAHGHPPHLHFEIRTINPCPYDHKHPLSHRISPGFVLAGHYGL